MAESKATAPHFYLEAEVDMSRPVTARAQIKAAAKEGDVVPSFNDMVVKACALALREHPRANGAYRDGRFELYSRVNVGVAVAARDALVVPTVFDADQKSLRQIATDSRALAQRVRDGQITPPELSGATFTVSNLGMFGIDSFAAVINPPQAAILAVGAIAERPVVRDGEIDDRPPDAVNLACDHRILYGAPARRVPRPHPRPARRAACPSPLRQRATSIWLLQQRPKNDCTSAEPGQQVLRAPVTAFQARPSEKSAATRKTPGCEARATVHSPRRSRQPAPRAIDQ